MSSKDPTNVTREIWIHQASYTYRLDPPRSMIETIWAERPGWGYLKRRDLWVLFEATEDELIEFGFVEQQPSTDGDVKRCPSCGMYISSVPGYLVAKHLAECRGTGENTYKIEEAASHGQRVAKFERELNDRSLREQQEQKEAVLRERFDRIKEENLARQKSKDRKGRMKQETREHLRKH
jgi:hypothetical protein